MAYCQPLGAVGCGTCFLLVVICVITGVTSRGPVAYCKALGAVGCGTCFLLVVICVITGVSSRGPVAYCQALGAVGCGTGITVFISVMGAIGGGALATWLALKHYGFIE